MKYYNSNKEEITPHQYYSCESKLRIRTRKKAENQLKDINRNRYGGASNLVIYECEYCNGFHIGNKVSKEGRKVLFEKKGK